MNKNILVVGSGEDYSIEKIQKLARQSDYIIACDGGYNTLSALNIKPDILIGDLDSITLDGKDPGIPVHKYPAEKDYSDSQLAIEHALNLDPHIINGCALTGTYFDHSFANIINLFTFCKERKKIKIITQNASISIIDKAEEFINVRGRRISFFPLMESKNIMLEGFKYTYSVKDINLFQYSLSNVIVGDYARITFDQGLMFYVLFDAGYR